MRDYINDVIKHSGKKVHPRLILTDADFKRLRECDDPVYDAARKNTISTADGFLDKEPLEYNIPDGIRLLAVSRGVLARSLNLGMAYKLTGDERYAERLYRELENVAAFKDWNPYHFLDVGEMAFSVGLGYDWIYDWMSEEQRRVVRSAIIKHAFMPVLDDYHDRERKRSYKWFQDQPGDNWKFVCNGGITAAALAICDEDDVDREEITEILDFAFDNTYKAVRDMYLPDGSYAEGFTYWNYATDYLANYISSLKSATGTDYGLADYEPVRKSAYYVRLMCSNICRSFNFGDAWETYICPEILFFLGKNYGDRAISTMRCDYVLLDPSAARVRDLFWYVPGERVTLDDKPCGFGCVGGDNASFRSGWERGDLYAAIHFGDNNAYHAHADMGTFVVEWKEKRFIPDLGQDNYNVKGNYRFAYRYRAEGHNTVVINPAEGVHDQERYSICHVDRFSDGSDGDAYAISDMSAAYFGKEVVRGIRMTEDRKWIIVRDEMKLDEIDVGYWFMHTRADVTLLDGGKSAILELDGDRLYVTVMSGGRFRVMPAEHLHTGHIPGEQFDNSEFVKLAVEFAGSTDVSVAIAPMSDEIPQDLPLDKAHREW